MKSVFVVALTVLSANFAQAETRIVGPAAAELYQNLQVAETPVADEHGGPVYAYAKYGKNLGCQRDLTSTQFECWILSAQ
jgi:hypothetical protein